MSLNSRITVSAAVFLLIVGQGLAAQPRLVVVEPNPASPTGGIQEAIDTLGPAGGTVSIPAGEFLLRQPVRLSSNTTLQGRRKNRPPQKQSARQQTGGSDERKNSLG